MSNIEAYLSDLDSRLAVGHGRRREILEEVRDHLSDSVAAAVGNGVAPDVAEVDAVAAFGAPRDLARQFNAAAGARAMRRAPAIAGVAGVAVVGAFLLAASAQPHSTRPASVTMQVSFFAAVLGFQIALVAGARGASRAAAVWRTSATAGADRELVRRSALVSTGALLVGTLAMATNFFLDARQVSHADAGALAAGGLAMVLAAAAGVVATSRLSVNADDVDSHTARHTPRALTLGDHAIAHLCRHPVVACAAATSAATFWAMRGSETIFPASLWWGISEAVTVIVAFVVLGPSLELRPAQFSRREL
jgi:hypothetical protein